MTGTTPLATVVIVNYNGAHLLPACLDGLARQSLPREQFKVVVVDNASADPSRDLLTDEYPDVELLISYRNRGFAGGNNVALERVDTPYAVLLNNDAVPEPDWLEKLLEPLQQDTTGTLVATASKILFMPRFIRVTFRTSVFEPGGLDPRQLGVRLQQIHVDGIDVTGKVLFEKGSYGPEGTATEQYRWSFPTGELLVPIPDGAAMGADHEIAIGVIPRAGEPVTFATATASVTDPGTDGALEVLLRTTTDEPLLDVVNNTGGIVFVDGAGADRGFQEIDEGQYDHSEEVFAACGNGVAMRTAAGRDVGFFDDRYFMYYEDVDLSWRLRAAGGRIVYTPEAVLRHLHSASSEPWSPRWLFHVERNRLLTLTKDATPARAARGVAMFVATTGKMGLRTAVQAVRTRRRPALAQLAVRGRILRSYARLLPGILRSRRRLGRENAVSRPELEKWLVTSR